MTGSDEIGLVWFRRDMRLDDNPAWNAATARHKYIVPLFILDPRHIESIGPFRRRQLLANLQALDYDMAEEKRGRLLVRIGDPEVLVPEAVKVLQVGSVYINSLYTPRGVELDARVAASLSEIDVSVERHHGGLVHAPGTITTAKGSVARGFKAFTKSWEATAWHAWPEPGGETVVVLDDPGEPIPFLDEPSPFAEGEGEARRRLTRFVEKLSTYGEVRDRADLDATSWLSTDLHFGTLSPRTVVKTVTGDDSGDGSTGGPATDEFIRNLALREWYIHLLAETPSLADEPAKERFADVAWRNNPGEIAAWKGGFTGYPIVDAGMRQLRDEGWMPQRVRAICASFAVKNLLVDWRIGEAHFRHLLVDGDLALSIGNWQSVAGVGFDAPPANRVLNPVSQGRKCDPEGAYVRRWIPELADLGADVIHAPWEVTDEAIVLDYPDPIVELGESRDRAVAAFSNPGAPVDSAEGSITDDSGEATVDGG